MPGASIRGQADADRVALQIVNDTVQFRCIAHAMVKGFVLAESF
jgi:hypothetical protein